jgi:hypothetical protein
MKQKTSIKKEHCILINHKHSLYVWVKIETPEKLYPIKVQSISPNQNKVSMTLMFLENKNESSKMKFSLIITEIISSKEIWWSFIQSMWKSFQ